MKRLKSSKLVAWILVILWLMVIYYFSNKNAHDSTAMSSGVILFIKQLLAFVEDNHIMQLIVRKSAHILEFLILFLLLYHACILSFHRYELTSILLTLASASFDEFHQLFIAGRSGQIKDVLIDMIGVVICYGVMTYRKGKEMK